MDLNTLWFILIGVLYIGYFILEGFDMGVGILLPFMGKDNTRRRVIINTIGPHWDGNEVWLLTAGGATFAAFPDWYATLFSGLYMALFIILMALIVRGVAFEFRSKDTNPRWRSLWDGCIFAGSLIPAFLWGVAFANFVRGLPINENMMYIGSFWDLLNGYALLGGLVSLSGFILFGAVFLSLKTTDELKSASERVAKKFWGPTLVLMVVFMIASIFATDFIARLGINPGPIPIGAGVALVLVGYFIWTKRTGWAFGMMMLTILFAVTTIFLTLFPRVMISSLNPAWSLTIYNASSGPYTLRIMTIVALIFTPIVLVYQGWTYWVFRNRVSETSVLHY